MINIYVKMDSYLFLYNVIDTTETLSINADKNKI